MKYQSIEYKLVRESNPDYRKKTMSGAEDVFNFFSDLQDATKEKLFSVCLTQQSEIVCVDLVSVGSNDHSVADPKEIIKAAILSNASSLIMVHNHPSGSIKPSDADTVTTNTMKEACKMFGITLLDHIIIGNDKYFSYANSGLI